jgi:hypothetical protein
MRAMSSLRWRASSASSSPVSGTTAVGAGAPPRRSLVGLLDEIAHQRAAPARNQPPPTHGGQQREADQERLLETVLGVDRLVERRPDHDDEPEPALAGRPRQQGDCWLPARRPARS